MHGLRPWRWAAAGLIGAVLLLAALLFSPVGAEAAWRPLARWTALVLVLALSICVALLLRRTRAALQAADAAWVRQQALIDALPNGMALWGPDGGLVMANQDFRRLYAGFADAIRPGCRFEHLLRLALDRGAIPEAAGREDAWLVERLAMHRRADGQPLRRQMPGGRWREIRETRLPDGSVLGHSVDVTEHVRREQALQAAQRESELARQRLEDAIEALPAGFELFDAEDRLVLWNTRLRELYPQLADLIPQRLSFETLVRANHARGGLPMSQSELDAWLERRLAERRSGQEERLLQVFDGRWVRAHERPTREGGVVAVRIDVSEYIEQKAAADAARIEAEQARQRLEDAIEALPDAFVLYDAADRLVLCNSRYREVYEVTAPYIRAGESFENILRRGLERGQYPQAQGREEAWLAERLRAHRNPTEPWMQELPGNRWLRIDERRTREGGIAGVRAEVTELVRRGQALQQLNEQLDALNAELRQLSETDALTGLANRRVYERLLAEEVARARRHALPLALLAIDIDHFKRFNDARGHPAGDAALAAVAGAVAAHGRRPSDLAARTGGEEFALLLPHTTAEEALAQAERVIAAVDELALPHGDSPTAAHVTLSVGVAALGPGHDVEGLKSAADAALYAAKQAGRHRVQLWAGDMPQPTSAAKPLG